tara:strand:- start:15616 stop:17172 length:1557 start_codon:yes stop_codon:yes gene_type:complete
VRSRNELSQFTFDDLGEDALQLATQFDGIASYKLRHTLISAFGSANYIYANKYYLTANGRVDGSSKFGADNKYGFFPSAAFAWKITGEPFMRSIKDVVSNMKLRTSYGLTGSQAVQPYATLNRYAIGLVGMADNGLHTATYPLGVPNSSLKWATTYSTNIGMDIGLWGNKLVFSVDAYIKDTKDLLINRQIPAATGFTEMASNLGELENRGLEFSIGYNLKSEKVRWSTNLNLSFNKTTVLSLGGEEYLYGSNIGIAGGTINYPASKTEIGDPVGRFFGWEVDGLIQVDDFVDYGNGDLTIKTDANGKPAAIPNNASEKFPGRWNFVDQNGDNIINEDDRVYIGDPNPDFVFGWNNTINIGNFDITLFFQGSYGNEILNVNKMITGTGFGSGFGNYNSTVDWFDNRYALDTPHNDHRYPSKIMASSSNTLRHTNALVEDGSYIRLKNVLVRYKIPLNKNNVFKNITVVASASNLFTLTGYSGSDPEVSAFGSSILNSGIDYFVYPQMRQYSLGFNLSF